MIVGLRLRTASSADLAVVLPRSRALNAHEGIACVEPAFSDALRRLLADDSIGRVWLIEIERTDNRVDVIGYAIVTYGYDLEFNGRDSYLTELWIDAAERGRGAGRAVLDRLTAELRQLDVRALHLQVRPDNPAMRLYERAGFATSPRRIMTKRLDSE